MQELDTNTAVVEKIEDYIHTYNNNKKEIS